MVAQSLGEPPRPPMERLLKRLEQAAPFAAANDPALKERVGQLLAEASAERGVVHDDWFQRRAAYAVQDVERATGARLVVPWELRSAMDERALSVPEADHEPLSGLLRETAALNAQHVQLAHEVRQAARLADIGALDAASDEGRQWIGGLEARVSAARAGEPAPADPEGAMRIWWTSDDPWRTSRMEVADPTEGLFAMQALARLDQFQAEGRGRENWFDRCGLEVFQQGRWAEWRHEPGGDDMATFLFEHDPKLSPDAPWNSPPRPGPADTDGALRVWWASDDPARLFRMEVDDPPHGLLALRTLARLDPSGTEAPETGDWSGRCGLEVFERGRWTEWEHPTERFTVGSHLFALGPDAPLTAPATALATSQAANPAGHEPKAGGQPDPAEPRTEEKSMDPQNARASASPPLSTPAPDAGAPPRAPMAVLMERLEQAAPFVSVKDPALKDRIGWLADEAVAAPAALDKPWFKTRVGYVVQDVERLNNTQLVMDPALRAELDKLALSSPGLRHEQLAALVRETAHLRPEDGPLAQDIRRLARSAVTGSVDVASDEGRKQVEQLAERVQAAKSGEPTPAPAPASGAADPAKADPAAAKAAPPSAAATAEPAVPEQSAVPVAAAAVPQPVGAVPAQPAASSRPAPVANAPAASPPGQTTVNAQQVQFRGTLRDILASARAPEPATPPPWSNEHAPLTGRLGSYEQRQADQNSDQLVIKAKEAAQSALRAVEALGNGPGSGVLSKIRQAAAGDPDGMPGVMAGMQPGGKYAQLRAEFNATMTAERAFAASYDKVASAAGEYATARQAIGADFARRGMDAAQLDGQFAAVDKAIGEGTAAVPGRNDGKSMQQELAEKAAEFFRQLMERVKTSFSPEQKPGAAPAPAPSPGMAM